MTTYRTQVRIVADVLSAAREFESIQDGIRITTILRKANIPYSRLVKMLKDLVASGLLEEIEHERGSQYRISDQGLHFLQAYSRFQGFASAYGLRL